MQKRFMRIVNKSFEDKLKEYVSTEFDLMRKQVLERESMCVYALVKDETRVDITFVNFVTDVC